MAAITILKNNVPTGPFTREQVTEKLQSGEVKLEDLAFIEGLSQWTPLQEILAMVGETPSLVPPPAISASPGYSYAASMQPPGHLVYGGFWIRFAAYFIDSLILSIPIFVIFLIFGMIISVTGIIGGAVSHPSGNTGANPTMSVMMGLGILVMELVIWGAVMVMSWLYFAKLESGPMQATYGKRALGLRVTNLAGERISFGQASGRFFGKILSGMVLYMGFIMVGFMEKKQGLHDLIAGTLVVRK